MMSGRDGLAPAEKDMMAGYWNDLNTLSNFNPKHARHIQAMSASLEEEENQRVKEKMHLSNLINHDERPEESAKQKHSINNPVPLLNTLNNAQEARLETTPAGFPDCILCPEKFELHAKLAEHIIVDHGYPKLECPYCDYKCARVGTMRRHVKCVHDKVNKFHCYKCNFSCASMLERKRHTRDQHSRCPYCQKSFERLGTHERGCIMHPKHAYIS